jgi:hypothetical protein
VSQGPAPIAADATLEFAVEGAAAETADLAGIPRIKALVVAFVVGVLILAGGVWVGFTQVPGTANGSLRVESDPPGAEVRIDGVVRGATPLSLALPTGSHTLEVQQGSSVQQSSIEIARGEGRAYHFSWATPVPASGAIPTGSLSITSDAPGSVVTIDGVERGRAPITVTDLDVGRHDVVVRSAAGTFRRSVAVEAGATASLVFGGAPAPAAWGWISLDSRIPLQAIADGRVIGTSEVDRIMLPPGDHQIESVSEPFGFRQAQFVRVVAGRGAVVALAIPTVAMNINALPWAEVFIDGARVGDTPLANVMQPLGDHEILFRHPQLGEKRQTARVTLRETPRIVADMRAR